MAIAYRSATEIASIRRACQVVAETLELLRAAVVPGITTGHLDALAARSLKDHGATSNFKGYRPDPSMSPYPAVLCTSVNEQVVHGIPGRRTLHEGEIISLDMGAIVDGWHGDGAITVPVGHITPEAQRLLSVTQESLAMGIAAAQVGNHVSDIARAVQQFVEGAGFSVVRGVIGHGIGRALHEEPDVPNYVERGMRDPQLRAGMVICIEPMVSAGKPAIHELRDGWTLATVDRSLAAHFEHAVAITEHGPEILTQPA
ncbi:MAG TPA: type I methionyl aminopeptidase [Ktedonobacterales bacterium]